MKVSVFHDTGNGVRRLSVSDYTVDHAHLCLVLTFENGNKEFFPLAKVLRFLVEKP